MTALRRISFSGHGVLELIAGLATMIAPFALGFSPAGVVLGVLAGAFAVSLGLTAFDSEGTDHDRGVIAIGSHYGLDNLFSVALLLCAVVLGAKGDAAAAVYFAALGIAQSALSLLTRYTTRI